MTPRALERDTRPSDRDNAIQATNIRCAILTAVYQAGNKYYKIPVNL